MSEPHSKARICPQCGAGCSIGQLQESDYICPKCETELAHLDLTPTGSVRRVLGWVKSVGDVIGGRYRVQTVLGKGGFAATYLVEDLNVNGRKRALKEIPASLFDEHELHFLSRIDHPAIPDITDRLTIGDMEYLVLKFGGSRTLESERKRFNGQIPYDQLSGWMLQLCDVLHYLHAMDPPIIHRDLKPANILLDNQDRVMLIDFGIAKESRPSEKTRLSGWATSHGFSAPEQTMGTGTDQRSDIYSFGATLYALLTGLTPPSANDRLMSGKTVLLPSLSVSDLPPALEKMIMRALEINPQNRPQSIGEIAVVLEGLQASDSARISAKTQVLDSRCEGTDRRKSEIRSFKLSEPNTGSRRSQGARRASADTDRSGAPTVDRFQAQAAAPSPGMGRDSAVDAAERSKPETSKWRTQRTPMMVAGGLLLCLIALAAVWLYRSPLDKAETKTLVESPKTDSQTPASDPDTAVSQETDKPTADHQPPPADGTPREDTVKRPVTEETAPTVSVEPSKAATPEEPAQSAEELLGKLRPKVPEPPAVEAAPSAAQTKKPATTWKKATTTTTKKTTKKSSPRKRYAKAPAKKATAKSPAPTRSNQSLWSQQKPTWSSKKTD